MSHIKKHIFIDGVECKTCNKCKRTLPLSAFSRHARTFDGYQVTCKTCYRALNEQSRSFRQELEAERKAIKYGTRLLYLCVRNVHDLYKKFKASDEPMSRQTLLTYLKAHPAYVGVKKGVRFTWKEPEYVARTDAMGVEQEGAVMSMKQETKISRCHVFDYDHLVAMMHIDLLRDKPTDAPVNMEEKPF